MKLLQITHPEPDYGAYFLYNGLRLLGVEVVEFPYQPIYHGKAHRFPMPWYGLNQQDGYCVPPSFYRVWDGEEYSEENVIRMVNDFDCVVVESPRTVALQTLDKLSNRRGLPPTVLVDSEDFSNIQWDVMRKYGINLCFKREAEYELSTVIPFPFSNYAIGDERFNFKSDGEKLDLFFLGGLTHDYRLKVFAKLKRIAKKHRLNAVIGLDREPPIGKDGQIPDGVTFRFKGKGIRYGHKKYLEAMAHSKIGISVRGWGRDTLRFWEVPSYDTLLVSDNLQDWGLVHPFPFTHSKNVVFFKNDLSDLEEQIVYYLDNEGERNKVIKEQRSWVMKHHTNLARAKFFLEKVKEWI